METDYHKLPHTIILSDLHLSTEDEDNHHHPLWKKFKHPRYFIDQTFKNFLGFMEKKTNGEQIELILNGDVFDFDSVTSYPNEAEFNVSNSEKKVGLKPLENKSTSKMKKIISDHSLFFDTLGEFIRSGHHVVFVIGNHDIELVWPAVQKAIVDSLNLEDSLIHNVRFCDWFYISGQDTLVEHGHQYDPYCLCTDPIHPLIEKKGEYRVRLPFGNLANRFMVNKMGLKNPHSDDAYVKTGFEFARFFFKYEFRIQPFLLLTWFFGAMKTLWVSVTEGQMPALKDPLTFEDRVKKIALKSNANPHTVLALKQNHAHPAVFNPLKVIRELWLDRAFLMTFIIWASWQFFTTSYLFANVSLWWFLVPVLLSLPFFGYYAHKVQSDVKKNAQKSLKRSPVSARTANVTRVVVGHTHIESHQILDSIEYLNCGSWTPLFEDLECEIPIGKQHFVWIDSSNDRIANLFEWIDKDGQMSIRLHEDSIKQNQDQLKGSKTFPASA
ncbi:MAG: metallophosphoesterase [Bacteriovoracaceae bacterium]|nr:metallophosphoesterase [Bacteriovoracaceae bacterium]